MHFLTVQFALLETSSVDDDLADLKKELSGSTKVTSPILRNTCNQCVSITFIEFCLTEGRASTGETGCSSIEVSRP